MKIRIDFENYPYVLCFISYINNLNNSNLTLSRLMRIILLVSYLVYIHASVISSHVPDQVIEPAETVYHASKPSGIHLESGSVSVLIPDPAHNPYISLQDLDVVKEGFFAKMKAVAPKLIKTLAKSIGKVAVVGVIAITVVASLIAIAVGFTTVLCKYTNLCTFELANFGYSNEVLNEAVRSYMSPDNLTSLSRFVINSIEKFEKYSKKSKKSN